MDTSGPGVPDFVLMGDLTEDAVFNNMAERFKADKIYTYIGEVVVSVNPYKQLPKMYTAETIRQYRGAYMYEVPPHVFSLSNDTYRKMLQHQENQCVIISGESGAGKTEASKILMNYVAAVSKSSTEVDRVKKMLLDSNPILEAFGNAKTVRNDNSSRFGKYMELQFEKDGAPVGGRINQYLLEKSRVVTRSNDERSFHIFYNLLAGLSQGELDKLGLRKEPSGYEYLNLSKCFSVSTIDDKKDFDIVTRAMQTLGFENSHKSAIWAALAGILHVGNVKFQPAGANKVEISTMPAVVSTAAAWQVSESDLKRALTYRSINTGVNRRVSVIAIPLDEQSAPASRDAMAKGVYHKLFGWLVQHLNETLAVKHGAEHKLVIGVLDIYGFEILETNSFEQFCINLTNEKLQQLFIELTLKQEQEEYVREGIEWTPIKYFNNKVICDLIEGKPKGLIELMNECCLLAESTDMTYLDRINTAFQGHAHLETYTGSKDRALGAQDFRIKHYAGDVTYTVNGMLDKNKDTLFVDHVQTMQTSKIALLATLFPPVDMNNKKRPQTAGTQFRAALSDLMTTLLACTPHYIRCVKPNDQKRAGIIDEPRVRHQIAYLGLLENVRVRRAGFAFRTPYDRFMWRYKMISKKTWPRFHGSDRDGTLALLKEHGCTDEDFRLGKTKVFIRKPTTLFQFEEAREKALPRIVTLMQAAWRGFCARSKWAERKAAIKIQLWYKKQKFNKYFRQLTTTFANVDADPKYGKGTTWPKHPPVLDYGVKKLRIVWANWRAYKMVTALTPEQQAAMRQKINGYNIFHGKKKWQFSRLWTGDYLDDLATNPSQAKYKAAIQALFAKFSDTTINFADYCNKINPRNKSQTVGIVITDLNLYKIDKKKFQTIKIGIPLVKVLSISLSPKTDTFVVVHCEAPIRDLVIDCGISGGIERFSEFVTVLVEQRQRLNGDVLKVEFKDAINYNNDRTDKKPGKDSQLQFSVSTNPKQIAGTSVFKPGKGVHQVLFTDK